MTDRVRSTSTAGYQSPKMDNDLSPRKTLIVLVIVVGCFAVLWPKVFYPMLVGSANQHIKPSPIDKTTGCCDVYTETDVNTIKIMSEICGTIIKTNEDNKPLSGKEIIQKCREEVLETCGIDISVVLQEQVSLGRSVKQILDEVRSLNGSLCLKYNFGVAPWRLGVPHRVTVKTASDAPNIRQERPLHLRSELIHPAFRERGRAISQPQAAPPTRPPPRVVEGRPGPIPGMRPTLGGAGHVVPPSKQGTSSMSVIMPIYTIGIVIFFTYTLMRIIFKKQPEGVGGSLYPPVEPDPHFRKEVFESEASRLGPRLTRENISSKLVVNAMSALLDEVDQEIEARRKSSEVASQDMVNGTLSNGDVVKPQDTEEQPTVKVLGMEMTASCEGGKKWSRPESPVLPSSPSPTPAEPVPPPQEIYLEGALPAQSHLLVSESATEPEPTSGDDPAVVLSGKMTLSVISLDSENGGEEIKEEPIPEVKSVDKLREEIEEAIQETKPKEPEYEIEEYVLEPIVIKRFEAPPLSKIEVEDIEKKLQEKSHSALISEEKIENTIQKPLIQLEGDDTPQTIQVEELEKEVDDLIQEAIENIEHKEPINLEILQNSNDNLEQNQPTLQVLPEKTIEEEISITKNVIENLLEEMKTDQRVNNEETIESKIEEIEEVAIESIEEENKEIEPSSKEETKKTQPVVEEIEEKPKLSEADEIVDDDELRSEEEMVEEIEEIEYESSEEEEEEISDEEVEIERDSSALQKVNGERSEDLLEESKYTTVSGATAAENDISDEDEELTDEEVDDEEEIIEIEEEIEEEDDDIEEDNDLNNVSDIESDPEL